MPLWPTTLPQAPIYGWVRRPQRNVASFQPDVGPPKYRRRSTASGELCSGTFVMTGEQLSTLREFYRADLADGSLPFSWVDPVDQTMSAFMFEDSPEDVAKDFNIFDVRVAVRRLP